MNLENFNNLINNTKERDFVQNFINELTNFIKNSNNLSEINKSAKYSRYWKYQKIMEDNLAANIGISKWSANIRYKDELNKKINNSILKLSESEGTLYRKKFMANGPTYNSTYSIDKFDNGKIEHLILPANKVPEGFENEDIIFQYKADGRIKIRFDLKEKAIKIATEKAKYLKEKENKLTVDYKKEGHIYQVGEEDGYIFLQDLTVPRGYVMEDIDFVVNFYQGEGKYQVINGEYKKIN